MNLNITKTHPDATIPTRAHDGDAGLDLYAHELAYLGTGDRITVSTGISVAIPKGYVGMVCPRSGLANRVGITVLNAPGIIDHGYTGELKVILINHGHGHAIVPGDRIAQLVITPIALPAVTEVDSLEATARGNGGFGSTGV